MKFDDVLKEIGEFGPYQKLVYFLVCLPAITCGIHSVISVFIAGVPDHRCAIPGLANDTYAIQNDAHAYLINISIPRKLKEGQYIYDDCEVFYYNSSGPLGAAGPMGQYVCDRWVYDGTTFDSTSVMTMDLVCSRKLYRATITTVFMAGKLVGSLVLGTMGDLYGRKLMLLVGCLIQLVSGIGTGFSTHYALLSVLRFFNGVSASAIFVNAFTIGMELVGPSKRKWTGIVIEYFFAFGGVVLAGVAYLLRDWKYLQIAVSIPSILFVSYWWILPESPRWLLTKGRHREAILIIERIARSNKTIVPQAVYTRKSSIDKSGPNLEIAVEQQTTDRLWHLFTSKMMFIRTAIIFINWTIVAMSYYGLALNSGNLSGSIYLNFFLNVLVEFPAYTLCILLLDRIGRKSLHAGMMILSGVSCSCSIFTVLYAAPELQWTTTMLSLIGKLGSSAAFAVIYVFTAELFPTSLRNGSVGISSMVARVGSMVAPYIAELGKLVGGDISTALPLVVFGGTSLGAGILSLYLPETLRKKLPDNMEESKLFGKSDQETSDTGEPVPLATLPKYTQFAPS